MQTSGIPQAGELAEAYPDCRTNLADSFDQWETPIRDGLRAMHRRGDLRPAADPNRLTAALLAAVQGGLLLTKVHRDIAPLQAALDTALEHISLLTVSCGSAAAQPPAGDRQTGE
jgi:TetR/AcrR family transcriptional regulator, transcriptional repressor for nem operon